jgi:Cu-Zn family superoxide dismutase
MTSGDYIYTNQNPWTTEPTGTDATIYINQQKYGTVAVYTWDEVRGERKICETQYKGASDDYWTKLQGYGNFITYSGSYPNTRNQVWKTTASGSSGDSKYFLGVKCDDTVARYREGLADPLWTRPPIKQPPTQPPTPTPPTGDKVYAIVLGNGNVSAYYGKVEFQNPADATGYTRVTYSFVGLEPNKLLGIHIHTGPVGIGNNCGANATLGYWNPENTNHGSNLDEQRQVGDMGNILTDEYGKAVGSFLAAVQPLFGEDGIINRSAVVHGGTNDLGLGGNETSRTTGNAGPSIACGTIQSGIDD